MEPKLSPVLHNLSVQRFELNVDGATAVAEYQRADDHVIFTHTLVPPELRGKGLAESLARTALDWARVEKLKVVPQCTYIARFIEHHQEYRDLL